MTKNMIYDLIVIGSSPASLIYSLKAQISGKSVAIIDNSDKIGGVWKKIYTNFGDEFELGPHLIANTPDAYHYIEANLGCSMLRLNPDPDIVFYLPGLGFISLNWRLRFLYFLPLYCYGILTRKNPEWRRAIWRKKIYDTIKQSLLLRNIDFRYPLGGSQTILDILEKKLRQKNVDIVLNTHVKKVSNGDGEVRIYTQDATYKAKKILLTSNSHGFELTDAQNNEIHLEHKFRVHHIAYMKFKNTKSGKISYTQIYTDKVCIRRVQDVTPYQNSTQPDEILLAVHIKDENNTNTDRIVGDLKKLKVIDLSASLMNYEFKTYKSYNLEQPSVEKIKRELNNVEYLDTSDLAVNLSNYLHNHSIGAI